MFTTLLVGLLTTGVLVLLPSTWQGDGRSLRYWVIGNLALSLDRVHTLTRHAFEAGALSELLASLAAACVVLGAAMHMTALHLLLRSGSSVRNHRFPLGIALVVAVMGWLWSESIAVTMMIGTSLCIARMLAICWPRRQDLRGALAMSAAMLFFLAMNACGLWVQLPLVLFGHRNDMSSMPMPMPMPVTVLALDLVLSVVVNLAFLMILIELLYQRVERLSVTDALTGVLNRRGFLQAANLQLLHARHLGRMRCPASVLLLDLDHFKRVNDDFGHAMGDAVLQGAARCAATAVGQTDVIARWGGEEFVVLLPGVHLPQARETAERIRLEIARAPLADKAPVVTVSIGVAALDELLAIDQLPSLIAEADRRLYTAKRQRNCVVTHDDSPGGALVPSGESARRAQRPMAGAVDPLGDPTQR